jgi:hypothetical protein
LVASFRVSLLRFRAPFTWSITVDTFGILAWCYIRYSWAPRDTVTRSRSNYIMATGYIRGLVFM